MRPPRVLDFAAESFRLVARSGVLAIAPEALGLEDPRTA
jgi:hypothetical protein